MSRTPNEMRKYSIFRDWNYMRLSPTQVRVWNVTHCFECQHQGFNPLETPLILNDITIFEPDDATLDLSHVRKATLPPPDKRAITPFAGGRTYCPFHHNRWLAGAVLPSEEILAS